MQIDSDTLLARIRQDFPQAFELSLLRCQLDAAERENQLLRSQLAAYDSNATGQIPAVDAFGQHHADYDPLREGDGRG